MQELVNQRASYIFGVLVLVTGFSFWLTAGHGGADWHEADAVIWTQVIVLASLKARWILLDFMELRTAPTKLRLLLEAWIVLVAALLISINWFVG